MKIEKHTTCTITVDPDDAISDVCVDASLAIEKLYGVIPQYDGKVSYACSCLIVNGGTVKNVTVRNNGSVVVDDGTVDLIRVETGGRLQANAGTLTRIYENGGEVSDPFDKSKCSMQFIPHLFHMFKTEKYVTIHTGNTFENSHAWEANIRVLGGTLKNYQLYHSRLSVDRTGTCTDLVLDHFSSIAIGGGTVSNVEVKGNSHVFVSTMQDENHKCINPLEHTTNVKVYKGSWIELYYYEGEEIPSIQGLTIEDGVMIHLVCCNEDDEETVTFKVYYNGEILSMSEYQTLTNKESK